MNIALSSFVLQQGKSGVARYIIDLVKAMNGVNNLENIKLLLPENDSHLIERDSNLSFNISKACVANPVLNILWHNTYLPMSNLLNSVDLLHVPSYRRIPFVKKCPLIATVHDLATFNIDGKYDKMRMFYNRKIVPSLIRRCDRLITVSEFSKNDIVKFIGYDADKIDVIYSGIDHQLFYPRNKDHAKAIIAKEYGFEAPFFTYVSRIEPKGKNHFRLLEAFEKFKKRHPSDYKLLLVGSDWNGAEAFHRRVADSPVKDDVVFTGFIANEMLPIIYSAAELCVYPSLFEGFGFPVIEAMACGAPVICSNTSSLREISIDRVPNFDPYNVDEIYTCMRDTIGKQDFNQDINKNLAYAKTFRWENTAQNVVSSYEKCLASI
ncbi:glycosyltransferase family 1 protein [Lentisphaera profundi]|uniref:Glycosyltransferase family 1 protein n=1 Tax=Lentisphaera profundi TaxID=1658616 RepID=A0ABY7W0B7_9BACT|nr:glycosyltransferase family 1 protein [Lentisphaera profundi]WDE98562.1 glycosyltransferase family 1 protein [Lentisphaera profundi]